MWKKDAKTTAINTGQVACFRICLVPQSSGMDRTGIALVVVDRCAPSWHREISIARLVRAAENYGSSEELVGGARCVLYEIDLSPLFLFSRCFLLPFFASAAPLS